MARWKGDYLSKHKRIAVSSDTLFKLTSPSTAKPQRRLSVEDYHQEYHLNKEMSREYSKVRAGQVKREH